MLQSELGTLNALLLVVLMSRQLCRLPWWPLNPHATAFRGFPYTVRVRPQLPNQHLVLHWSVESMDSRQRVSYTGLSALTLTLVSTFDIISVDI